MTQAIEQLPVHEQLALAIMSYHETGKWYRHYGKVSFSERDPGGLSVGWGQAALQTDERVLGGMLEEYVAHPQAQYGANLMPYMPGLRTLDRATQANPNLHDILRAMASDIVWRGIQDRKFLTYMDRARAAWQRRGWTSHLGLCLMVDMFIQHGSDRFVTRAIQAMLGEGHAAYQNVLKDGAKDGYKGHWGGFEEDPDPTNEDDQILGALLMRLDYLMTEATTPEAQASWRASTYRCAHLCWLWEHHEGDFGWGMKLQTVHPDNNLWTLSQELLIG